jgi:arylsulfatase A-like enzyme
MLSVAAGVRPRNVLLLVIDSLRAAALQGGSTRTPFLDELGTRTLAFRRAHATECWTLPSHASMFTGLLPSEHGAHFQSMDYTGKSPTVAELLGAAGHHTEIVTRNSIFDGSIPGLIRGFRERTIPLSDRGTGLNPLTLVLALSKPRVRRQIRASGFFAPLQRDNREFLARFTRAMLLPADVQALDHVLDRMARLRHANRPYFLFCNLYDVHAPYCPSLHSMFRPPWPPAGLLENVVAPLALAYLGSHVYQRPGFHLRDYTRRMLLDRYHRATELMDAKLAHFWREAERLRLLEDTCVILCSDHGEEFGEHGLYLHDASVYQTHLHVPLWIHHPECSPAEIDDVVSLRDLFGLMRAVGLGEPLAGTMLSPAYRAERPLALAQHFYYPHVPDALPRFRQNIMAAVGRSAKVIVRREGLERYDLAGDPEELHPAPSAVDEVERAWHAEDVDPRALRSTAAALRSWAATSAR